jgi:hypothetical protein
MSLFILSSKKHPDVVLTLTFGLALDEPLRGHLVQLTFDAGRCPLAQLLPK